MIDLNYNEYGKKGDPVLLILHGFLGAGGNWHSLSRNVFSDTHHVFALDLRNHGDSPHSVDSSYSLMAGDVARFIETRALDPVDIIGHSMGGKVAMELAITRPELVRKLIVVDISPGRGNGGHEGILSALLAVDLSVPTSRREVESQLAQTIESSPVRQFLLKNLRSDGDGHYKWKNNLPVLSRLYSNVNEPVTAGVFEGDTLFIKGSLSPYIRETDWPAIVSAFPKASLVALAGAGHWVHAEKPDQFATAVNAFLSANDISFRS